MKLQLYKFIFERELTPSENRDPNTIDVLITSHRGASAAE